MLHNMFVDIFLLQSYPALDGWIIPICLLMHFAFWTNLSTPSTNASIKSNIYPFLNKASWLQACRTIWDRRPGRWSPSQTGGDHFVKRCPDSAPLHPLHRLHRRQLSDWTLWESDTAGRNNKGFQKQPISCHQLLSPLTDPINMWKVLPPNTPSCCSFNQNVCRPDFREFDNWNLCSLFHATFLLWRI